MLIQKLEMIKPLVQIQTRNQMMEILVDQAKTQLVEERTKILPLKKRLNPQGTNCFPRPATISTMKNTHRQSLC